VDTVARGSVAAGPLLLRAPGRGLVRASQRTADRSIMSAGIVYERMRGLIRPGHLHAGEPAPSVSARLSGPVAGLAPACVLVHRAALAAAGGPPTGYRDAGRDATTTPYLAADLGARLRAAGGVVTCDARAVAWWGVDDHEPTTASTTTTDRDPRSRPRWVTTGDPATFLDRWGPRIVRQVLGAAIHGDTAWTSAPLRLVVIGGAGREESTATGVDWVIDHRPAAGLDRRRLRSLDADVVVVGDPDVDIREVPTGIVRIALVADTTPRHLDEFDLVLAVTEEGRSHAGAATTHQVHVVDLSGPRGWASLREPLSDWIRARRIGIRIGAKHWGTAHLWGDYHFAIALQRYLERAGHPARIRLIDDWASEAAAADDATVHIFGLHPVHNRPSQVNVLWHISHPDLATPDLYDRYDHVFVASDAFAMTMRSRATVPVTGLHQATDPERFHPEAGGPPHDVLYVANYRDGRRVVDLFPTSRDVAVYGRGWDAHELDPRYHRGEHIPNTDLARYYGAASIVLNDTWEDMRAGGFISNRIYDVLASGGFVLSDDVVGLDDEFDGGVPVYRDAADLRAAVDAYLGDPEERQRLARTGRAAVLARHTFEQRAATILSVIRPRWAERPPGVAPSPTHRADPAAVDGRDHDVRTMSSKT
jgi:glycosyltransferase involved in cell wall biosynthesis